MRFGQSCCWQNLRKVWVMFDLLLWLPSRTWAERLSLSPVVQAFSVSRDWDAGTSASTGCYHGAQGNKMAAQQRLKRKNLESLSCFFLHRAHVEIEGRHCGAHPHTTTWRDSAEQDILLFLRCTAVPLPLSFEALLQSTRCSCGHRDLHTLADFCRDERSACWARDCVAA